MKVVAMDDDGRIVELPALSSVPGWLKKNRSAKKMSLQEVGEQLGVTKQAVYSWESGIAQPTPDNLAKLVGIFQSAKPVPEPRPKAVKVQPPAEKPVAQVEVPPAPKAEAPAPKAEAPAAKPEAPAPATPARPVIQGSRNSPASKPQSRMDAINALLRPHAKNVT